MATVVLKKRDPESLPWEAKNTYYPVKRDGLPMTADIICANGHHDTLVTEDNLGKDVKVYTIDKDGKVSPTFACRGHGGPKSDTEPCTWTADIQLEGWQPE